jgi:spermidine synthase
MGATLPVLTQALGRVDANFGANMGRLYGWNTLGAMFGVISTELVLVATLGILGSGLVAMGLNLVAALVALRISQRSETAAAAAVAPEEPPHAMSLRSYRYLAVGFLSGAVMLALEVVWFRFLLLTHRGTGLIFAVMLAVVLAGIALGGLIAAQLFRRDELCYRWLTHVTAASAALVVLTYAGYDLFTVYQIRNAIGLAEFVVFAVFLMLPVAVLSGMAFTMVGRAVKDELGSSIRTAGIATLWNTLGAMLGSLLAGFVLLPLLGMEAAFFALSIAYLATALLVPGASIQSQPVTAWSAYGTLGAALLGLVLFPFGLMQRSFFVIVEASLPNQTLVAAREGVTETVRYYRRDVFGEPHFHRLVTNGYSMSANNTHARRYMKLYVYLPLALKPDATDALLISYGVGSTAKALTDSRSLDHIDVVDISRDILEMSSVIYPGEENPLRDDRVTAHVEDGRFFLNTTAQRYDLITSEPPPPKIAGVVNLYSREYFQLIRQRLKPGGYASYWLPVHQLEPADTLAILKAFCTAFSDCSLWSGGGLEWMLLGANEAAPSLDPAAFAAQWRDPTVRDELTALGFEHPAQLGSLFMADATMLNELTAAVAPVTDNFPLRISSRLVSQPGRVPLYELLMDERQRLRRFRRSEHIRHIWPAELLQASEPYFVYERLIKNHFTDDVYRHVSDPFLWQAIDDLLTNTSLTTLPLWLLGSDRDAQAAMQRLQERGEYQSEFDLELALQATSSRDFTAALLHTESYVRKLNNVSVGVSSLYLYLLAKNDRLADAQQIVDNMSKLGLPELDSFLDWYTGHFGLTRASLEVAGVGSTSQDAPLATQAT